MKPHELTLTVEEILAERLAGNNPYKPYNLPVKEENKEEEKEEEEEKKTSENW